MRVFYIPANSRASLTRLFKHPVFPLPQVFIPDFIPGNAEAVPGLPRSPAPPGGRSAPLRLPVPLPVPGAEREEHPSNIHGKKIIPGTNTASFWAKVWFKWIFMAAVPLPPLNSWIEGLSWILIELNFIQIISYILDDEFSTVTVNF